MAKQKKEVEILPPGDKKIVPFILFYFQKKGGFNSANNYLINSYLDTCRLATNV